MVGSSCATVLRSVPHGAIVLKFLFDGRGIIHLKPTPFPHYPRRHAPVILHHRRLQRIDQHPVHLPRHVEQRRLVHQEPLRPVPNPERPVPPSAQTPSRCATPAGRTAVRPAAARAKAQSPSPENAARPAQNAAPSCRSPHPQTHPQTASSRSRPLTKFPAGSAGASSAARRSHMRHALPDRHRAQTPRTLRAAGKPSFAHTRTRRRAPASPAQCSRAGSDRTHKCRFAQIAPG